MVCANRIIAVSGVLLVIGAALCLSIGCGGGGADYQGDERAAVAGSVTLDGGPLATGTITFVPTAEGKRASAMILKGNYSIAESQGPNLGKYKVEILGFEGGLQTGDGSEDSQPSDGEDDGKDEGRGGGPARAQGQLVPAKYNTATTLEVEIASGENKHDFDLTSK
jgi:hypothetical protein